MEKEDIQQQPSRGVLKLACNFVEITLSHRSSPVNLLHIFMRPFLRTPLVTCKLKGRVMEVEKLLTNNC